MSDEILRERICSNDVIVIGQMDNTIDHTFESANRIYSKYGCCPTIPTSCGGGHTPKILADLEKRSVMAELVL